MLLGVYLVAFCLPIGLADQSNPIISPPARGSGKPMVSMTIGNLYNLQWAVDFGNISLVLWYRNFNMTTIFGESVISFYSLLHKLIDHLHYQLMISLTPVHMRSFLAPTLFFC